LSSSSFDNIKPNESSFGKFSIKLNISRDDLLKVGYSHKRSSWSSEEDKKLLKLVKSENHNWK
jgi:hypothetical protein